MAKGETGVVFPRDKAGKRSTSRVGKAIVAEAAGAVSAELAGQISAEKKWHKTYPSYIENLTKLGLGSAENAISIAQTGLDAAVAQFEFVRDGETQPLQAAMQNPAAPFFVGCIKGEGTPQPLAVPYKNGALSGQGLRDQLNQWVATDIIEASHRAAVEQAQEHVGRVQDSAETFVLLGAGSEMGPYETLLAWGATVVAIDLDRSDIWMRLIEIARNSAGTLIFPLREAQSDAMNDAALAAVAGADLLTQTPEIAAWLIGLARNLVVGNYAYLDGGDHIRVVLAMDAITQTVSAAQPDTKLAFLLTPTDVFGVPPAVKTVAEGNFGRKKRSKPLYYLTGKRWFRPSMSATVGDYGVINSLIPEQGANYMLAKRLQRWRATVARHGGQLVSCNIAPMTFTQSVLKRQLFATAYSGAESFGVEVFLPETTKALMAAALINDIYTAESKAQPTVELRHSAELFIENVHHGGLWRNAYQVRSVLVIAVLIGFFKRKQG